MATETNASSDKVTVANTLALALRDASNLLQTDSESSSRDQPQHHNLKSVLESRLSQYYTSRNQEFTSSCLQSLRDAELLTACEALSVVEQIQKLLVIDNDAVVPAISTRDLSQIRTLLSLIFKWGTGPVLKQVTEAWPTKSSNSDGTAGPSSKIVDLSNLRGDYDLLSRLTLRILELIFPNGVYGKLTQSLITTTLLDRYLVDVLQPSFALGWLPKSQSTEDIPVVNEIRPLVMRLLSILPTSQAILSLGSVISGSPPPPMHSLRACRILLSKQLLRPDGVWGLFAAMFGEGETSDGDLAVEKLEHVSTTLNTVPANTKPQDYFGHVIPPLVALLSVNSPPTYRRAASFTISHMLCTDGTSVLHPVKAGILFSLLHGPLLHVQDGFKGGDLQQLKRSSKEGRVPLRPDVAINALLTLLSNADPSPTFISHLLAPIVPALYSLLYHLNRVKTSDPKLKESLHGMLLTWGKIAVASQGVETLWSIVRGGQQIGWKIDLEGHIWLLPEPERLSSLSLLMPQQVPESLDLADPDFDANIFDLYPDPLHFVQLLKDMNRGDVSSDLFIRLLEAYREERSRSDSDSLRVLLYLQIIMQMQRNLSEGTTSNILKRPQQTLSFIHHVLESTNLALSAEKQHTERSILEQRLKLVRVADVVSQEGDSDDDAPDSEIIRPDDELIETAISLLLSMLEADESLSARTMPILNEIFSLLEFLSKDGSPAVLSLAREARLVMTARLASTSQLRESKARNVEEETTQEIYQKALKLLQDPILPVRGHGLLLLRQLVTPSRSQTEGQGIHIPDPALAPAILSIFLQSVQDEDSYIFLNSVQGLAAMVDGLGKEVLKRLIDEYAGKLEGLGASVVTQREVDVRTRVGEALSIVIKRCGDALGIYADTLIPPLFGLVRMPGIPTTLRTSALSLLADCVKTYPLAVLAYMEDLAAAMVDLVQVESVPVQQQVAKGKKMTKAGEYQDEDKLEDVMKTEPETLAKDAQTKAVKDNVREQPESIGTAPTSVDSKSPPLRRAALHFLGLLVREATRRSYESSSDKDTFLSQALAPRLTTVLEYVASTDEDNVVRMMAREAKEGLGDLRKAKLGL